MKKNPARDLQETYFERLEHEFRQKSHLFSHRTLSTIYLGGGTPSLADPVLLQRFVENVKRETNHEIREFTLESNPNECTPTNVRAWKDIGVNRVSLGVQSLQTPTLKVLGRDHTKDTAEQAISTLKAANLHSFSCDLIVGVSSEMDHSYKFLTQNVVPHISTYELTIEPKTPLAQMQAKGEFVSTPAEKLYEQYVQLHEMMTGAGYEHYEVSSFARPGHQAIHNSYYWQQTPYLGIGLGASGFALDAKNNGWRWTNPRKLPAYLEASLPTPTMIQKNELQRDALWLGLRSLHGIPIATTPHSFHEWLLEHELAQKQDSRLIPTLKGYLFHDQIVRRTGQIAL